MKKKSYETNLMKFGKAVNERTSKILKLTNRTLCKLSARRTRINVLRTDVCLSIILRVLAVPHPTLTLLESL